jgi:hypothetical protein
MAKYYRRSLTVRRLPTAVAPNGKNWVYVSDYHDQPLGWVFREFLQCGRPTGESNRPKLYIARLETGSIVRLETIL